MLEWIRSLLSGSPIARQYQGSAMPPAMATRPVPLLWYEGLERPPVDLLRLLRLEDPTLELVGVGNGRWWLGRIRPNRDRTRIASNILKRTPASIHGRLSRIQAHLAIRGFARISEWDGPPDGRILLDLRQRFYEDRHGIMDAEFEQRMLVSDGTQHSIDQLAKLNDLRLTHGKEAWKWARGRRSFATARAI